MLQVNGLPVYVTISRMPSSGDLAAHTKFKSRNLVRAARMPDEGIVMNDVGNTSKNGEGREIAREITIIFSLE